MEGSQVGCSRASKVSGQFLCDSLMVSRGLLQLPTSHPRSEMPKGKRRPVFVLLKERIRKTFPDVPLAFGGGAQDWSQGDNHMPLT